VLGDAKDLALVGGELGCGLVDGGEDSVGAGPEADTGGVLLDGLHGVLHLEEPPITNPSAMPRSGLRAWTAVPSPSKAAEHPRVARASWKRPGKGTPARLLETWGGPPERTASSVCSRRRTRAPSAGEKVGGGEGLGQSTPAPEVRRGDGASE
jgi:hypothetical protein